MRIYLTNIYVKTLILTYVEVKTTQKYMYVFKFKLFFKPFDSAILFWKREMNRSMKIKN